MINARRAQYLEVRGSVHRKLLTKLNLEKLATAERSRVEAEIRALVSSLIAETGVPLSVSERDAILGDVIDEVFGFGPLEPLLRDKTIRQSCQYIQQVLVERAVARTGARGVSGRQHLLRVVDRIVISWAAASTTLSDCDSLPPDCSRATPSLARSPSTVALSIRVFRRTACRSRRPSSLGGSPRICRIPAMRRAKLNIGSRRYGAGKLRS